MVILCNLGVGVFYVNYLEAQILKEEVSSSNNELISIYLGDTEGNYTYSTESSFPTTGYEYNEEKSYCVNESTLSWNGSQITVNTIGSDNCYVYFDEIQTVYLANYVTDLVNTTQGDGEVVDENGYRYEGSDPNNYVTFNNQTWRIIGVFETDVVNEDGSTTQESLVKIVKEESIGDLEWDDGTASTVSNESSNTYNASKLSNNYNFNKLTVVPDISIAKGSNIWSELSLYSILNEDYYSSTGNYTSNGLVNSQEQIQEVVWNLGGTSIWSMSITADDFYAAERGTEVYNNQETSTTGNVGLMYMSDYAYASLEGTCSRMTTLSNYSSTGCYDENWLYTGDYFWTIVPDSSGGNRVWYVNSGGYANSYDSSDAYGVLPVLYLKSEIEIISGEGTASKPYILSA